MSYTVQPGDSLSAIAARAGVPMAALLQANPRLAGAPDMIHPGELLTLPALAAGKPGGAISAAATQLILNAEVSSAEAYCRSGATPCWPQGQSGVTIGVGYDLGYASAAQFRADWSGQLESHVLDRLAPCCGLVGAAAERALDAVRDIAVPWDAAVAVFGERTLLAAAQRTRAALANTGLLPADSFGALVSLVYNRGASFAAPGDRYSEMRAIAGCMGRRDFAGIPGQLRAMQRLWRGVAGMAGLVARREQEAALFEAGLATLR